MDSALLSAMTTVNWEREPGEKIEEFVAALLLLKHPHGNQPTPSRGDRGVDVRVWNPDGYDIYQVKRYSRPLTAKQAASVKGSWKTFAAKTLPVLPVRSWTLVTPWEPSNERLERLEELTAGCGIRVSWMGGRILDGMAAENPALVDYFFGDGGRRLERLMTMALHGGQDVPRGAAGEDLLAAIVSRQQSLAASLNEVDPFYRYEVQVRTGRVKDLEWDADLNADPPAAFVRYLQVDEACHLVIKLLPRCAESARLRPITMSVDLEVPPGSAEQQAVADWRRYGSPFHNVPATITHVSGPPGITPTGGPGQISFLAAASQNHLPDLEIRLTARGGTGDLTLGLRDPQVSSGQDGSWLAGVDCSGVLTFQVLLSGTEDKQDRIQMSMSSLTGATPADVLPAVRLVAALPHAEEVVLAVRGGRPLTPVWEPEASQFAGAPMVTMARQILPFLEALQEVQAHTFQRVSVPALEELTPGQVTQIVRLGRLLRGEQIRATWSEPTLTATGPLSPLPEAEEFGFMATSDIRVNLPGQQLVLTGVQQRIHYHSARFAESPAGPAPNSHGVLRLVPGSVATATVAVVPAGRVGSAPPHTM